MKKRTLRSVLWAILAILLVLIAVVVIRTFTYPFQKPRTVEGSISTSQQWQPSEESIRRFSGGIRIPTVSVVDYSETDFAAFTAFKRYLEDSYPQVYSVMDTLTVNGYGLVFRWPGENSGLDPILFLSHYDVVPVVGYNYDSTANPVVFQPGDAPAAPSEAVAGTWEYQPFSGAVAAGRIYGRGTLDMKGMLFGLLEAADALISEGFVPQQDIWFAFGQDEEVGGLQGATHIAEYFRSRGLRFDAVFDEGGLIDSDGQHMTSRPLALIGVAEKGLMSIRIQVFGLGGHSSMPPRKGSLDMAAEIMEKLNRNQLPARIIPPVHSFLTNLGGELGFVQRMAIANQWLLGPVLIGSLEKSPAPNALLRTTTAITMAKGSDAPNVLSSVSEVTVNFRLLPGDSINYILRHVEKICEGYDTNIEVINAREASGISPEDTKGFRALVNGIDRFYPGCLITSYMTIGGTDAYKYQLVSGNVYRFMPIMLTTAEQRLIHNENEYISLENFGKMTAFFREIMVNYQNN